MSDYTIFFQSFKCLVSVLTAGNLSIFHTETSDRQRLWAVNSPILTMSEILCIQIFPLVFSAVVTATLFDAVAHV